MNSSWTEMAASKEIPSLDRAGLRRFGLVTGAILAALFGLFFPFVFGLSMPRWPWIVAAVLAAWAIVAPSSLDPIYRGWMRFGLILNRITTPIVLAIVFYGVIAPIGLVMRTFGKDPMTRRFDASARSYRVTSSKPKTENMTRPF